jgi:hypothetical protein
MSSLVSPSSQSSITDNFSSGDIILGILLLQINRFKDESNKSKQLSKLSENADSILYHISIDQVYDEDEI